MTDFSLIFLHHCLALIAWHFIDTFIGTSLAWRALNFPEQTLTLSRIINIYAKNKHGDVQ